MNELFSFLGMTKSNMIDTVIVIYGFELTKSSSSADTLLYLVSLNSGYAVISADKRIPEDILMYSDNGVAAPEMFYGTSFEVDSVLQSGSPYYNATYDDYYIGGEPDHPETFIMEIVYQYAQAAVSKNGTYGEISTPNDSLKLADGTTLDVYPIRKNIRTYTETKVDVMMNTLWDQRSPYNSYVPHGKPAGCVPIAIAQIMTYNKYPTLTIGNTFIDWDSLGSKSIVQPNTLKANMVGLLIRYIQVECYSISSPFNDKWTFTLPKLAKNFLSDIGYDANFIEGYDESALFSALSSDTPVFIAGVQDYLFWKSHGWVIDGWKRVFEKFDVYDKYTGDIIASDEIVLKNHLVHCNWGNRNEAWVTSGAFKDGASNYNTWLKMITYDKPF